MNKDNNILLNAPMHNHLEPALEIDKKEFIKVITNKK